MTGCLIVSLVFVIIVFLSAVSVGDVTYTWISLGACVALGSAIAIVRGNRRQDLDSRQKWLKETTDVVDHPFRNYDFRESIPELEAFADTVGRRWIQYREVSTGLSVYDGTDERARACGR